MNIGTGDVWVGSNPNFYLLGSSTKLIINGKCRRMIVFWLNRLTLKNIHLLCKSIFQRSSAGKNGGNWRFLLYLNFLREEYFTIFYLVLCWRNILVTSNHQCVYYISVDELACRACYVCCFAKNVWFGLLGMKTSRKMWFSANNRMWLFEKVHVVLAINLLCFCQ